VGAVRMRRRKEEDSTGSAADCSVAKGTGAIVSRSTADLTKACVCVCVSKALQPKPLHAVEPNASRAAGLGIRQWSPEGTSLRAAFTVLCQFRERMCCSLVNNLQSAC